MSRVGRDLEDGTHGQGHRQHTRQLPRLRGVPRGLRAACVGRRSRRRAAAGAALRRHAAGGCRRRLGPRGCVGRAGVGDADGPRWRRCLGAVGPVRPGHGRRAVGRGGRGTRPLVGRWSRRCPRGRRAVRRDRSPSPPRPGLAPHPAAGPRRPARHRRRSSRPPPTARPSRRCGRRPSRAWAPPPRARRRPSPRARTAPGRGRPRSRCALSLPPPCRTPPGCRAAAIASGVPRPLPAAAPRCCPGHGADDVARGVAAPYRRSRLPVACPHLRPSRVVPVSVSVSRRRALRPRRPSARAGPCARTGPCARAGAGRTRPPPSRRPAGRRRSPRPGTRPAP